MRLIESSSCYADVHVILLCYAIDAPDSFQNITEKWVPELKYWTPGVDFILVGCKVSIAIVHRISFVFIRSI